MNGKWLSRRAKLTGLLTLGGALVLGACSRAPHWISETGKPLDAMAERLEEYGTITMSAPMLSKPDAAFGFDLNRDVNDYFKEAKSEVQGGAASLEQVIQSFSLSAAVQADPTQMAAYGEKVRQYYQQASRQQMQQNLVDSAAESEFRAAVQAAQAEKDPQVRDQKLADARTKLAASLAPQATPPPFPVASDVGAAPTPATSATPASGRSGLLDSGAFKAAGALLPANFSPTLSNRTALVTAAGDKAVEAIFRVLGNPGDAQRFKGKIVTFGAAAVSVDPGWRTRKDFAADLTVRLGYQYEKARPEVVEALIHDKNLDAALRARIAQEHHLALPDDASASRAVYPQTIPSGWGCEVWQEKKSKQGYREEQADTCDFGSARNPVTAAVSPMTETQTLDLASSSRRIDEVSIALSFALRSAGYGAQADAFEDFVKSRQSDARTRTAAVPANSYSASGGVFGYQVGPILRAIDDAGSGDLKSANVLDRQSFPVLIILGLDASDIRPRLHWCSEATCSTDGVGAGSSSGSEYRAEGAPEERQWIEVYEPVITFNQIARWVPLKSHWYYFGRTFRPRWSEEERLQLSYELNLAPDPEMSGEAIRPTLKLAKVRTEMLKHFALGSFLNLTLPVEYLVPDGVPKMPKLAEVVPDRVTLVKTGDAVGAAKVSVAIVGDQLDQVALNKISVATGNAKLQTGAGTAAHRSGNTIIVPIEVQDASTPVMLELPFDPANAHAIDSGIRGSLYTRPIVVSVVEKSAPNKPGSATRKQEKKDTEKKDTAPSQKKDSEAGSTKQSSQR